MFFSAKSQNNIGKRFLGNEQTLSWWAWYGKVRMNRFHCVDSIQHSAAGQQKLMTDKSRTFYLWMSLGRPPDCQAYEKFTPSSIANGPNSNEIVSYHSYPATQGGSTHWTKCCFKNNMGKNEESSKNSQKTSLPVSGARFLDLAEFLSLVFQCFCGGWQK